MFDLKPTRYDAIHSVVGWALASDCSEIWFFYFVRDISLQLLKSHVPSLFAYFIARVPHHFDGIKGFDLFFSRHTLLALEVSVFQLSSIRVSNLWNYPFNSIKVYNVLKVPARQSVNAIYSCKSNMSAILQTSPADNFCLDIIVRKSHGACVSSNTNRPEIANFTSLLSR